MLAWCICESVNLCSRESCYQPDTIKHMDMKFKNNVMERSQKSQEGGEKKKIKNQIMVYARPISTSAYLQLYKTEVTRQDSAIQITRKEK